MYMFPNKFRLFMLHSATPAETCFAQFRRAVSRRFVLLLPVTVSTCHVAALKYLGILVRIFKTPQHVPAKNGMFAL